MAFGKGPKTARQVAASRRNIVAAQRRSAELRRGGAGKGGSTNFYGKGRSGRKAARRSKYGQKKHGLSIAQTQRRKQRANKYKRIASGAASGAALGLAAYSQLSPMQQQKVKATSKHYAKTAQTKAKYHTSGLHRQVNKHMKGK
jgi:hypothetical protein